MPADIPVSTLAKLVREMREAQKTFFRTRDPMLVDRAKRLERKVDELVNEILDDQRKLF